MDAQPDGRDNSDRDDDSEYIIRLLSFFTECDFSHTSLVSFCLIVCLGLIIHSIGHGRSDDSSPHSFRAVILTGRFLFSILL